MAGRQGRRGRRGMTPATIPSRRGDSESKSRFSLALSTTGCRRARPSSVRGLKMLNGAKTGELNSHVDSQNDKRLGLRNSHRQNAKNGNASANICGRFLRVLHQKRTKGPGGAKRSNSLGIRCPRFSGGFENG